MANFIENLKSLGGRKLAILAGTGALTIAAIVVLILWTMKTEYTMLYSGLSSEDAGQVIEALKSRKVDYTVSGSTIKVPSGEVHELRMELASSGIPQGGTGVGYEIFDKTGFGITEFVQKINYSRALQGELARTVGQIDEVESARVHLVIPEKGVFLDKKRRSKASIVLQLRPGAKLTPTQVNGIVHLAVGSVENLTSDDVTIVDTSGTLWTKSSEGEDPMGLSSAQLDKKKAIEKSLEERVQTMLERTVGVGKAIARVSVDVETSHVETTEEIFDPDGQVARSEHSTKEKMQGGAGAGGAPGVLSNLPGGIQGGGGTSQSSSELKDETVNYEISKKVNRTVKPVGEIKRITVAVLVDGTYAEVAPAEVGEGEEAGTAVPERGEYIPRSEEELGKFSDMVKAAIGFSEDRDDLVTVVSTQFESGILPVMAGAGAEPIVPLELIPMLVKYGTVALVIIFAIIFIFRPIMRSIAVEKEAIDTIKKSGAPGVLKSSEKVFPEGRKMKELESEEFDDTMNEIKRLIKQNPRQAAMILKGWLKD